VILDEGASRIADVLQDALGAGFHVVAFPPADDVIAMLTAAPPRLIYAHSQLHPTVGLIMTGVGTEPDAVAAILDAGADDCQRDTNPRELAARLVALCRRRAITADRHPRPAPRLDLVEPST
jgi:hypothetical protein